MDVSIDIFINTKTLIILVRMKDTLKKKILKTVQTKDEPLETKEIIKIVIGTRIMILQRLHNLRGEGLIKGKYIGSGKGTWIWWRKIK